MKYIYLAGPLTSSGQVTTNVHGAMQVASDLRNRGFIPFVPHLTVLWAMIEGKEGHDVWLPYDLAWLRQCDALIRLPGTSLGADIEVAEAERCGLPVYYGVEAFNDALSVLSPVKSEG